MIETSWKLEQKRAAWNERFGRPLRKLKVIDVTGKVSEIWFDDFLSDEKLEDETSSWANIPEMERVEALENKRFRAIRESLDAGQVTWRLRPGFHADEWVASRHIVRVWFAHS